MARYQADAYSKTQLLAQRLVSPGPPLTWVLEGIRKPSHRQALLTLFAGDLFLARYAGNYFAKDFIPHTLAQRRRALECGVDANRICIHCWHIHRHVYAEDELHVLFHCPRYERERADFLAELTPETTGILFSGLGSAQQLQAILQSQSSVDWEALARFVSRVRQSRRHMRSKFQQHTQSLKKHGFANRRADWRNRGFFVCRHGVFFHRAPTEGPCCCLTAPPELSEEWSTAKFMPDINTDLRHIVAVPFEHASLQRLRVLQNRLRMQDEGM